MEHSYIDNAFVNAVMTLLSPGGAWHKKRIVWAGDYGDLEFKDFTSDVIGKFVAALDGEGNLYSTVTNENCLKPDPIKLPGKKLIVNHSKKRFINLAKVKADGDDYKINPLPLLTSDGNGRGGGDYSGTEMDHVGSWAGDQISVETKRPEGYEEIEIDFKEER
jgi:hypothetical protein